MRTIVLPISLAAALVAPLAFAQEPIYRCGNEYTNNPAAAKNRNCKLIDGGNVTVVQGNRARNGSASASAAKPPVVGGSPAQRVDPNDQRARDADARAVLESELRKSEAKLAELRAEYKDGQPEKIGGEARNYQKYLDRVAELKAAIARTEADIAGIRRELGRFGGASAPVASTAPAAPAASAAQ